MVPREFVTIERSMGCKSRSQIPHTMTETQPDYRPLIQSILDGDVSRAEEYFRDLLSGGVSAE